MKNYRPLIVAAAAVLVVSTAFVSTFASQMLKGRPTAVAVIDVEKVFNALAEKTQIEADLNSRQEKLVAERQERERELKNIKAELDLLNPSNPGFLKKQEELERKLVDLQVWGQWQTQSMMRENRLQITGLYNKITAACGKVSKGNGYDVVLFKESTTDFSNVKNEELSGVIRSRKVLWAAEDLDITDQVIQAMNNDYKNNVSAGM